MADTRHAEAVDILARRAVACLSGLDDLWDDYAYPLAEEDLAAIDARIRHILDAHNPTEDEHQAAYKLLAGRAEQ